MVLTSCAGSPPAQGARPELVRAEFEHPAMGTLFRLTLFARDETVAARAADAAFGRIDAIERVATDYDASSEARRLSGAAVGEWVAVSSDLALVVRASDRAVAASEGAFDPTVGVLIRLWRRALRDREWPRQDRWDRARAATGWAELVELEERDEALHVRLGAEGMRLDFGAIAKGVAVDEALGAVEDAGVRCVLLDGGGDLAALDPPPGEAGWRVEVRPRGAGEGPRLRLLLVRAAVATSGDAFMRGGMGGTPLAGIEDGSALYGHVIDPRSGLPLRTPRAAVMTAGTASLADAHATARLVLGGVVTDVDELERGIYMGGVDDAACVGAKFPHDGVQRVDALPVAPDPRSTPEETTSRGTQRRNE